MFDTREIDRDGWLTVALNGDRVTRVSVESGDRLAFRVDDRDETNERNEENEENEEVTVDA